MGHDDGPLQTARLRLGEGPAASLTRQALGESAVRRRAGWAGEFDRPHRRRQRGKADPRRRCARGGRTHRCGAIALPALRRSARAHRPQEGERAMTDRDDSAVGRPASTGDHPAEREHAARMRRLQAEQRAKVARAVNPRRGLVLVHTGNGKGKSSAAFGVAARALGWGQQVGIVQFIKGKWQTGERRFFSRFPDQVAWRTTGQGFTWDTQNRELDIATARDGLDIAREFITGGRFDLVVLDEINVVSSYDYLPVAEIVDCLEARAERTHVVLTGPRRRARADRIRRPGQRDGGGEAPLPGRYQGAARHRLLIPSLSRAARPPSSYSPKRLGSLARGSGRRRWLAHTGHR